MAVIKLGVDLNLAALVDFADEKRVPMARACEQCGEQHHPRHAPMDGARYYIAERWLCPACAHQVQTVGT